MPFLLRSEIQRSTILTQDIHLERCSLAT
jgi:hypothetical protein